MLQQNHASNLRKKKKRKIGHSELSNLYLAKFNCIRNKLRFVLRNRLETGDFQNTRAGFMCTHCMCMRFKEKG